MPSQSEIDKSAATRASWVCYRAERARIKADKAEEEAAQLEAEAWIALASMRREFEEGKR